MRPRIKMGLIVGLVGLLLNILVSALMGICGPFFTLLAGTLAGFLAGRQEKLFTKGEGAKAGALAGSITGALMLVGQILGAVIALFYIQQTGITPLFGSVPSSSADPSQQFLYYGTGLITGTCFGSVGLALAALAGAGGGYLGTPSQPVSSQY